MDIDKVPNSDPERGQVIHGPFLQPPVRLCFPLVASRTGSWAGTGEGTGTEHVLDF